MKELALIWGENGGDSPLVIVPLEDVTQEVYDTFTLKFGKPKGKTVEFSNGGNTKWLRKHPQRIRM